MTQKTNTTQTSSEQVADVAVDQVALDFKNAVFIVSVVVNLAVVTTLITLQVA
jgi:hypothetical protein